MWLLEQMNISIWHLVHSNWSNLLSIKQFLSITPMLLPSTNRENSTLAVSYPRAKLTLLLSVIVYSPEIVIILASHKTSHVSRSLIVSCCITPHKHVRVISLCLFLILNFFCWNNQCRFYFPIWHKLYFLNSLWPSQKLLSNIYYLSMDIWIAP